MASSKKKYYVVWIGFAPGVYETWAECEAAIKGFSNHKFKTFPTLESAQKAFAEGPEKHWGVVKSVSSLSEEDLATIGQPVTHSMCVDATWNTETRIMEYRGIWFHDRTEVFRIGPLENATINMGEFLAIVHALALMKKQSRDWPIYSDSQVGRHWVCNKGIGSEYIQQSETSDQVKSLLERAVRWLNENEFKNEIRKWETAVWGENPADFGRKRK
jgi:ribonuclease HI